MKPLAPISLTLLLCACNSGAESPPPSPDEPAPSDVMLRLELDGVSTGALPPGWTVAETHSTGTPATWSVGEAPGGGRGIHVATSNSGRTYNLLLSPREHPADVELSVRVRAASGEEDQGGGLVWRARGPDDYYIARWNPLEDNLRVYKVERGERTLLQSADTPVERGTWHALTVSAIGGRLEVALDGETLLDTTDATFAAGGRVGFWTKADASTWFADLELREPRWPDER